MSDGARALQQVNSSSQRYIIDLAETLMGVSPQAVAPFLANLDMVLTRVTLNQLEIWFQRGMAVLKENPDGGIAYFKVESSTSENLLESLSSSMELERVKPIIRLYCCALSGSSIEVQNSKELANKSIGWVSESAATTEGTKVFLPPVVDRYSTKDNNFGWFKVVSTHQVAHLEFGSFLFEYDRPFRPVRRPPSRRGGQKRGSIGGSQWGCRARR